MVQTAVRRLFVVLAGYEILPRSICLKGADSRFIMALPISCYVMDTDRGWLLFDAGIDHAIAEQAGLRSSMFEQRGWTPPIVREQHRLDRRLAAFGIEPADIGHVVLSHLHYDHTGYLKQFPRARVSMQRREWAAWRGGRHDDAVFARDLAHLGEPDLHDGDWSVLPGLDCVATFGHTEGHQSAVVTLRSGQIFVLAADAGDLRENFNADVAPGHAADVNAALRSIERLSAIANRPCHSLVIGHDPEQIRTIRQMPSFYD